MMMRCISREEGIQLLKDTHSGVCRSHSSWRSIIGKALRNSFYWLTTKDDAMEIITKYKANHLRPIDLSWPFAIWGINIVGILPSAPGGFRFLFIVMEAMTMVNITQEAVVRFLQSIIYRFSVPR
jgi:hypothetical protein